MADNGEDHAGENKIAEKQEGGGCEANEERQTLVCFLNSVRMPLLVIRLKHRILLSFKIIACNCSLSQQGCLPPRSLIGKSVVKIYLNLLTIVPCSPA
ncbi:hypothetical protein KY289_014424 [Solanum tuberosum]|nr:hypothetical protein KY289_014424 [Solanum tuberosum]KAH0699552.1 hypothetical protein KY284_013767 [Solanum tuberosum]